MSRPHKMLPAAFRNGASLQSARASAAESLSASSDLRQAISLAEQKLLILLQQQPDSDIDAKLVLAAASKLKDLAAARSSLNSDARENIKALGDDGFMQSFMAAHAAIQHMLPSPQEPASLQQPDSLDPPLPPGADWSGDLGHTATLQPESFQVGLFPTPESDDET